MGDKTEAAWDKTKEVSSSVASNVKADTSKAAHATTDTVKSGWDKTRQAGETVADKAGNTSANVVNTTKSTSKKAYDKTINGSKKLASKTSHKINAGLTKTRQQIHTPATTVDVNHQTHVETGLGKAGVAGNARVDAR
ncbi:hypothetical protein [Alkanindiges illinoisensis]|uniref:Uncharacterized protein n=1 Tax=Alkanindiges illinoisensis TaxID=197183 RepID=A0A4Y7XGZ7_9GAMM|nr:hypothetical protein [Alkanindiges illinoisensis]TEU30848.1 hypothetical protein E2B99_00360 [Alkanindiges illinoisensis]